MSLFDSTMEWLNKLAPNEPEYMQAAKEICHYIVPIVNANEDYKQHEVLRRFLQAQQILQFTVEWEDDKHNCRVNLGWRVQHNNLLGPYKGGTRFHPQLNLSILKFLALEQSLKNSLSGLQIGSGKGGANFDAKNASKSEIRRFSKAYMRSLTRHIGAETDVPAGDINVSSTEIGYMFAEALNHSGAYTGVLSGKPITLGGSELRAEATGYGLIYFVQNMLKLKSQDISNKKINISGAGNVAMHAAEKAIEQGAIVQTLSNSRGLLYAKDGLHSQDIDWIKAHKQDNPLLALAKDKDYKFIENQKPWSIECDIALPCATQNELNEQDAKTIVDKVSLALVEGANMPCTSAAADILQDSKLLYGPGKAANAGGVVLSTFEMQQNTAMKYEQKSDLDHRLQQMMQNIHQSCVEEGKGANCEQINYVRGANIAGFRRVADAIVAAGY